MAETVAGDAEAIAPARAVTRLQLLLPLLVFLGLAALLAAATLKGRPKDAPVDRTRPLPAFALQPLRPGQPGLAKADLGGRPVLLNVFASWCASCAIEQPVLAQLASEGQVRLYGVDWLDTPDKATAWLAQHGDPYRRIGQDTSGRLGVDLGVTGAPETFVVDGQGRIRYRQIGPITEQVWAETLQPLMARLDAEAARR